MPAALSTEIEWPPEAHSTLRSRFPVIAWVTLGWTVVVVLEGALVRATGSGAGCGKTWPLCNGALVFGTPPLAKAIEFTHRSLTGIDSGLIFYLMLASLYAFPKNHPGRTAAVFSMLFLITEALIGAALVVYGLVDKDASPARAAVLALHQANTLTLLAFLTLTAWWSKHPRLRINAKAWATLAAVVLLAITGALTALADTLYPAQSLAAGIAQDLSANANFIVRLRALHPFIAVAVGLWAMYYATQRIAAAPAGAQNDARKPALAVIALVILQLLAGALNLALLTPIGMQILHLLLADLLWIALVLLCAS